MKFMGNTCEKTAPTGVGAGCLLAPARTDMVAQLVDGHDNDHNEVKMEARALNPDVMTTNCPPCSQHILIVIRMMWIIN